MGTRGSSSERGSTSNAGSGGLYGLGFLGAIVYFLQTADGFWDGVLGVLQALVWPAFLVYELLGHVNA